MVLPLLKLENYRAHCLLQVLLVIIFEIGFLGHPREHVFPWGSVLMDLMGFNLALYALSLLPARRVTGPSCKDRKLMSSRGRRWMQRLKNSWRRNHWPIHV